MVRRLGADDREAVVDVLVSAFWDYPVMRFILAGSSDYEADIRTLVGMYADLRLVRGWPVLGVGDDGTLVAASLVSDPMHADLIPEHADVETQVRGALGEAAWERMEAFEAESSSIEPAEPHYYVGMIGVRPEHQGRGLSRQLMDAVIRISTDDPRSKMLALSTETEDNLPYYEHLGFSVIGEASVGELRTWSLALLTP